MKIPKLVGVTHNEAGELIARVPRATKINIGKPKGKALHVYLSTKEGRVVWTLEIGSGKEVVQRIYEQDQLSILKRDYFNLRSSQETPNFKHPEKLPYFTFFRDAGDGTMAHDFDAIEKHGVKPRTISIVFTDADPWDAAYEFWSAKGLLCRGDGKDARRSVDFAQGDEERKLAEAAKANRQRYFPIVGGCASEGCPFAKPLLRNGKEVKQCGVHGRLSAQLINDIRLGAKAEYQTTGFKTIDQLTGSLNELATFVGQGNPDEANLRGIPLQLSVGQFKTNHNGQAGTAYAVRLEFRAGGIKAMRAKLIEAVEDFGLAMPKPAAPAKQLAAPAEKGDPAVPTTTTAAAENAEEVEVVDAQYVGEVDDDDDAPNASYMDAQFDAAGGGDDEEGIEQQQESFEEARAAAMREAEVEDATPAKSTEDKPVEEKLANGEPMSADEFSRALGGGRYEDPGEQNDRPKKGMRLT